MTITISSHLNPAFSDFFLTQPFTVKQNCILPIHFCISFIFYKDISMIIFLNKLYPLGAYMFYENVEGGQRELGKLQG